MILVLFCAPLAIRFFAVEFFPSHPATPYVEWTGVTSPFAATFAIPLDTDLVQIGADEEVSGNWLLALAHLFFSLVLNGTLLVSMIWLFHVRCASRRSGVAASRRSGVRACLPQSIMRIPPCTQGGLGGVLFFIELAVRPFHPS